MSTTQDVYVEPVYVVSLRRRSYRLDGNLLMLADVRQRADLTFKFNRLHGRHGWLRLTPAYSVKLVEEVLGGVALKSSLLDPFSGSGTTPLAAASVGLTSYGVDINPFLIWLGGAKTRRYSCDTIQKTDALGEHICERLGRDVVVPCEPPAIHNIERWWSADRLRFLCLLKASIDRQAKAGTRTHDLLSIAFCKTMIRLSNAAFNHQSMSFKDKTSGAGQGDLFKKAGVYASDFLEDLFSVTGSAAANPQGTAKFLMGNSRDMKKVMRGTKVDIVLTSPPYANRMSYIRELRPYMYWLSFLKEARQAGELDWQATGGTWGIATSRLSEWKAKTNTYYPRDLRRAIREISCSNGKNGALLSNYVAKYFEDMWLHFSSLKPVLNKGAKLHYIVGNSKFYDVMVHSERVYCDMLKKLGFHQVNATVVRKRNSKKELFEFDVSAVAPAI